MSLKTTVKVSHLSNLSDARYCAGMGVEMLGFCVIPGEKNYMAPNVFQDIRGWVAGPAIVAELYGVSSAGQIDEVIRAYAPDYVEMSFDEYRKFSSALSLPCIVSYPAAPLVGKLPANSGVSHIIVEETTSCDDLHGVDLPVLVRVGSAQQVSEKLRADCFSGIALEAPREQRPGITGYDQLGLILEALEEE